MRKLSGTALEPTEPPAGSVLDKFPVGKPRRRDPYPIFIISLIFAFCLGRVYERAWNRGDRPAVQTPELAGQRLPGTAEDSTPRLVSLKPSTGGVWRHTDAPPLSLRKNPTLAEQRLPGRAEDSTPRIVSLQPSAGGVQRDTNAPPPLLLRNSTLLLSCLQSKAAAPNARHVPACWFLFLFSVICRIHPSSP